MLAGQVPFFLPGSPSGWEDSGVDGYDGRRVLDGFGGHERCPWAGH